MPRQLLLPLVLGALASCYNPQIVDGGLRCSASLECPSGFTCAADGHCYKQGSTVVPPGMDASPAPPSDDGGGGTCESGKLPYGPFAGCSPQITGACDPVCQAGCPCDERCEAVQGNLTCAAQSAPFAQVYDTCDATNDTCTPGDICLVEDPTRPLCAAHCYRHCRADSDCQKIDLNSKCNIDIAFGTTGFQGKACSTAPEVCNPWGSAECAEANSTRPYPTFACYVFTDSPNLASCECAGMNDIGKACMFEHDCKPGAECVAMTNGTRVCLKVCVVGVVMAEKGACPSVLTQKCTAFSGSNKYGYCLPAM